MEKLFYTWDEQFDDTNKMCDQLEADEFIPDVVVGISRGGLIPGVMISHKLEIPFKPVHASTRDFPHWENYLPKPKDEKLFFNSDSDALIAKGLVTLIASIYSDEKAEDIVSNEIDLMEEFELGVILSPARRNGAYSMLKTIKEYAKKLVT